MVPASRSLPGRLERAADGRMGTPMEYHLVPSERVDGDIASSLLFDFPRNRRAGFCRPAFPGNTPNPFSANSRQREGSVGLRISRTLAFLVAHQRNAAIFSSRP